MEFLELLKTILEIIIALLNKFYSIQFLKTESEDHSAERSPATFLKNRVMTSYRYSSTRFYLRRFANNRIAPS
ncbi:hypothetical protein BJI48_08945 [Helicobacter sp. 11S02596-1]|nr:hypothetical protein BJI48_08945 [Helicobacter sp. 11S02596-1]